MPPPFAPGHPRWWQWLTVLSLDAPLVALAWQELFARVAGTGLAWHYRVLLGLAVWLVYAADRWIEGWRLDPRIVQTQRHLFYIHWRWPVFALGAMVAAATTGIAVTHLTGVEFKAGFLLLVPTLAYLLSHQLAHRHLPWRAPKELCVAVIFSVGTALGPALVRWLPAIQCHLLSDTVLPALSVLGPSVLLFGLLCFANCALISSWEKEVDTRHGQTSLALQWSRGLTFLPFLPWLAAGLGLLAACTALPGGRIAGFSTFASGLLLGALDFAHPRIGRERARALVDITLLTPAVLFLTQ